MVMTITLRSKGLCASSTSRSSLGKGYFSSSSLALSQGRISTSSRQQGRARKPRHHARRRAKDKQSEEEPDFITGLVGKIFGQDVLADPEPFGLKRMTKEEWPDQWPAVVDAWADVLPSDEGEIAKVRPVLKQTQMEYLKLGLAYDASVHGWTANAFHTQLDGQGAALLVGTTDKGTVFGGYNPRGWLGYGEWRDAISAFLFVFDGAGKPTKLPKLGGSGMAIIDESGQGPQWGPDGLKINIETRTARSRLGTYYEKLGGREKSMFRVDPAIPVQIKDLRVYVAIEETELAKNYKPNLFQWGEGELEEIRKNDDLPKEEKNDFFGGIFGDKDKGK